MYYCMKDERLGHSSFGSRGCPVPCMAQRLLGLEGPHFIDHLLRQKFLVRPSTFLWGQPESSPLWQLRQGAEISKMSPSPSGHMSLTGSFLQQTCEELVPVVPGAGELGGHLEPPRKERLTLMGCPRKAEQRRN